VLALSKTDTPTTHHALRACLDGRHEARGHTETARAPEGARGIQRAHPSYRVAYGARLQRQRQLIARQRVVGQVQQASCAGPSGTKVSLDQVCGKVQNAPDRGWRRTVDSISASSCTIAVRCSTLPSAPREALICGASTRRVARRCALLRVDRVGGRGLSAAVTRLKRKCTQSPSRATTTRRLDERCCRVAPT
jgi:hypothetical protein